MDAWSDGTLIAKQEWAPGLVTLRIEAEIERFAAGQFTNLGLWQGEQFVRRSYTMASAPGQPLEFFVTRVPSGELSPGLLDVPLGGTIHVERKPQGFFTLAYVPQARDLWMIATGTGLGPFISMLRTAELWQRFERIVVVHGVRQTTQLAYRDELFALSAEHERRLAWVPVVSREPDALDVVQGRVTTALRDDALEQRAGLKLCPDRSHVLLCGNPDMIAEMTAALGERGLKKHRVRKPGHISTEKYW
jgi:ferredoxin--NADP+ reductase